MFIASGGNKMYEVQYQESTGQLVDTIREHIEAVVGAQGVITIGIPGGRSVRHIIAALAALIDEQLDRIRLLLVDERLEGEKNIDTIMESGLADLIAAGRFSSNQFLTGAAPMQLVFLGVGEDGHAASLFPRSFPHLDRDDTPARIEITNSPKPPKRRVTITYRGFRELAGDAKYLLLFLGEAKRDALRRFMTGESPYALPSAFFRDTMRDITVITDLQEVHT